jgi:hypothetical protein
MMRLPSVVALKQGMFGVALVVGIAGMALQFRWLVWVAAGILAVAFLLRFVGRSRAAP